MIAGFNYESNLQVRTVYMNLLMDTQLHIKYVKMPTLKGYGSQGQNLTTKIKSESITSKTNPTIKL